MSAVDLVPRDAVLADDRPLERRPPLRGSVAVLSGLVVVGVAFRLLWVSRNGASFDESFTAMIGRHSLGGLFDALRAGDSHPPLDYLLRAPFARAGAGDLVMRFPSLVFSTAALALFAWWMRTGGRGGLVAVAVMAVSPFQIMYGGEARMYALLELLGVAAAIVGERWCRDPRKWHAGVASALVLVAVFDHISGWLLALGLLALAGLRRDAVARQWRLAIACALAVWAAVWGSSFLAQAQVTHASWIDHTSFRSMADAVAGQVTNQRGVAVVVVAAVVFGIAVIVTSDRALGRVVLCCGAFPVVLGAMIGVFVPFFIDRTVTVAAWVPCLAIGLGVDSVWRRSRAMGVAVAAIVAALVLPATVVFLGRHWEYDASVDHLLAVTRSGDVVATVPDWYGPLVDWRVGARGFGAVQAVRVDALPGGHAILLGGHAPTGRAWVLSFAGDHRTYPGVARCAPDWTDGVTVVSCVEVGRPR